MILQTELTASDSKIQALQEALAAERESREAFAALQTDFDQSLSGLRETLSRIEQKAGRATVLTDCKQEVLNLFTDGGNDPDDGTGLPEDEPPPESPSGTETAIDAEVNMGDANGAELEDVPEQPDAAPQEEPEAAPTAPELVMVTDCVGYVRHQDTILSVHVGGRNKQRLLSWANWLVRQGIVAAHHLYKVRPALQLKEKGFKHELTLPALTTEQIEVLAEQDFGKTAPRPECGSALPPRPAPQQEFEPARPEELNVGDIVAPLTNSETHYRITKITDEGYLQVISINLPYPKRDFFAPDRVGLVKQGAPPQSEEKPEVAVDKDSPREFTLVVEASTIVVQYEPPFQESCHLEFLSPETPRQPIPISDSGYRSHFTTPEVIEQFSSIEEYALCFCKALLKNKRRKRKDKGNEPSLEEILAARSEPPTRSEDEEEPEQHQRYARITDKEHQWQSHIFPLLTYNKGQGVAVLLTPYGPTGLSNQQAELLEAFSPHNRESLDRFLQQYLNAKDKHPDHIVFVRQGDFYETFLLDALNLSTAFELILTSKNSHHPDVGRVAMTGFPVHALPRYQALLEEQGYSVAITQPEDAEAKKSEEEQLALSLA